MYCSVPNYLTPDDTVVLSDERRVSIPVVSITENNIIGVTDDGEYIMFDKSNIHKIIDATKRTIYDNRVGMIDTTHDDEDCNIRYAYRD